MIASLKHGGLNLWTAAVLGTMSLVPPAYAAGDSDADAAANFAPTVEASDAVMIRVPTDGRGGENTSAAEIRVVTNGSINGGPSDYLATWDSATDATQQPIATVSGDSNTSSNRDASTNYYGWNPWRGNGVYQNYYANYRPTYYYGFNYWSYGRPTWYSDFGGYPNYCYYYYPRWR